MILFQNTENQKNNTKILTDFKYSVNMILSTGIPVEQKYISNSNKNFHPVKKMFSFMQTKF